MKIMQCWDDAPTNDVRLVELFRKYNAKSTFNIIPPRDANPWLYNGSYPVKTLSIDEMKSTYQGFKVAGHGGVPMQRLAPEILKAQLEEAIDLIRNTFGQEKYGLAYPGGGWNDEVKKAVQAAGFLYARTTRNVDGHLPLDDPMELHTHCEYRSPDFWAKYEKVRELNGVFYFWGHSYELMDNPALWSEMEDKLARISSDPQAEWIDVIDLFA